MKLKVIINTKIKKIDTCKDPVNNRVNFFRKFYRPFWSEMHGYVGKRNCLNF